MLTIKELINHLKKFKPDTEVIAEGNLSNTDCQSGIVEMTLNDFRIRCCIPLNNEGDLKLYKYGHYFKDDKRKDDKSKDYLVVNGFVPSEGDLLEG